MQSIPKPALWLGLAGLIPFLAGAFISLSASPPVPDGSYPLIIPKDGLALLASYGVVILCFMSGVLWGFAVNASKETQVIYLTLSVIPALYCFFFVQWGGRPDEQLINLIIGFIGILGLDYLFFRRGLAPEWWMKLRLLLTVIVVSCLAIGTFA